MTRADLAIPAVMRILMIQGPNRLLLLPERGHVLEMELEITLTVYEATHQLKTLESLGQGLYS